MSKFKKLKSEQLQLIKKITEEEAIDAFINYNVEFSFHEFDNEVKTVYVYESRDSPSPVEHYMLENMSRRVKEINPRYRVGIIFEEKDPEAEELEEIKQSFLQDN